MHMHGFYAVLALFIASLYEGRALRLLEKSKKAEAKAKAWQARCFISR